MISFLALGLALVLEQLRPLAVKPLSRLLTTIVRYMTGLMATLAPRRVWLGWSAVVAVPVVVVLIGATLSAGVGTLARVLFDAAVLYLALGLGAGSAAFSDIHLALSTGNNERARQLLQAWTGVDCARASSSEVARVAIEQALVHSYRTGFGVVFWFVMLGPVGAVAYCMARRLVDDRPDGEGADAKVLHEFSLRALALIDWLPVRLTAVFFSVIGNFEDAIYCWRSQSMLWSDKASGILIASGAGALGVRLGLPIHASDGVVNRPEMGTGHKADTDHMQGAAQLVWRVLLLWLLLLALFGLTGLVGR